MKQLPPRQAVAAQYGQAVADCVRFQYGGSVKPENISQLMAQPNVDGALVGGASLKAESFIQLVHYVSCRVWLRTA